MYSVSNGGIVTVVKVELLKAFTKGYFRWIEDSEGPKLMPSLVRTCKSQIFKLT